MPKKAPLKCAVCTLICEVLFAIGINLNTEYMYIMLKPAHLELLSTAQGPLLLECAAPVLGRSVPHQSTIALCVGSCTKTSPPSL